MKQREIWFANLNPTLGNEQKGVRPVVIISGNAMNDHSGVHIVCPLTTKIKNYAGNILLKADADNGLSADSEMLIFQIRTVAKQRFLQKIGEITVEQLLQIKKNLQDILTY